MKVSKIVVAITFLIIVTLSFIIVFLLINNKEEKTINENPIEYFKEVENAKDENKIKKGFTDIVDFIFYGKEINGKTFSELKDDTKVKLLNIALSIDKKIDDYFPNYKNNLKDKYQNVKIKIVETYINTVNKICDSNPSFCDNFKSDFNNMKEKFGITFDYIKKYGKIGLDKIKDWYEDFKN